MSSENFMHRCIQLAQLGAGHVAPNPMVGAVLVYDGRIIGEGLHERFGGPHAEVNCLASVKADDQKFISQSTMFVSLEPCSHFGKTPPCADLIVSKKITKVIIGSGDPYQEVRGKGIQKLKTAGIDVELGVLQKECVELNKRFFHYHQKHRPYVILKWAQSSNGKMARADRARFTISNEISKRLVHKWRSEEASILVGTNTAFFDDPDLGNRFWHGSNPLRLVVDMELRLPATLKIFNGEIPTIVFNRHRHSLAEIDFRSSHPLGRDGLAYYQVALDADLVQQITHALYQMKIQSVLVEGGAKLLQAFIDEDYWDEIRLITNRELELEEGISSPAFSGNKIHEEELLSDRIEIFKPHATT